MIIGVICGLLLLVRSRWVTLPVHYYVEIFRCTPLLVQIVWFYYALPIVLAGRAAGLVRRGPWPHALHGRLRHRDLPRRHHLDRQGTVAGVARTSA